MARISALTRRSIRCSSSALTGLEVREVETQPVRCHQRALLDHVRSQFAPQRRMQQMRGGMIEADRVTAPGIDAGSRAYRRL